MENLKEVAGQPARLNAPGTYYMVEGEPSIASQDLSIPNATFAGLVEFVRARKEDILALKSAEDAGVMVGVKREDQQITLKMREHGGYKAVGGSYMPATQVTGTAKFSKDHLAVKELLSKKFSALGLSQTIRANRHLFSDETTWDKLVKQFSSMSFQISKIVEDTANDVKGDRKRLFQQQITNVQEVNFSMRYPIHVGTKDVDTRIDVLYEVGTSTVELQLIALNMERQEREAVNVMMDTAIADLKKHLGTTIPFVELN